MSAVPLLDVAGLRVAFATPRGRVEAVRGVSFTMGREKLGIVGESGSGKSCTGRSLLRLLPGNASLNAERMAFEGVDLLRASPKTLRTLRGRRISMVMQDPKFSLNPVMTIGDQIAEAYRAHSNEGPRAAREKSLSMLEAVRIREPRRAYGLYPHEVSGGMGQRAMIAMMLAPDPDLLIADEPTSALDVTVQMQVLAILDDLVSERGMGLVFISHDLTLVGSFCDRVLVMYGGRVLEALSARDLRSARHPYTRGLMACLPTVEGGEGDLPVLARDPAWLA